MSRIPGNEWVENPNRGFNPYVQVEAGVIYKPVLTYHQTVGMGLSKGYVAGHSAPPHNWINPYTKTKWQTQELTLAAKALYQPQYSDHWVNRHFYNIQCEIVGVPEVNVATYTDEQCKWIGEEDIAPKVQWLRDNGMDLDLNQVHQVTDSSGSASEYWSGRCSEHEMAVFNGVTQHIKWPGNDHWDCSVERLDRIAMYARAALGETQIKPKEKILTYLSNRAEYVAIGVDGHVYHKTYDTRAPAWIPGGSAWNPLGSPNEAGRCKSLSVYTHEDWLTVVVAQEVDGHPIFQKRHHPAHGWINWEQVPDLQANEVATVVRFTVTVS